MAIRVAVNGMGRIGRLAVRAGWDNPAIEFVAVNDRTGDAATQRRRGWGGSRALVLDSSRGFHTVS